MAKRKLPFGYEIRQGKISVQAQEASIVKEIFKAYVEGASYQQLANRLNIRKIPYNESGNPWNKNMVARILNNKIYTGNEDYPGIIPKSEQRQAAAAKPSMSITSNTTSKAIRQLARCAGCGNPLVLSSNRFGWARWNCPSCGALTTDATTPAIMDELMYILDSIISEPGMVQAPVRDQADLTQSEKEFSEMIRSTEFDESAAKAKAIAIAAAQFDALGSEDYETMRIQHILTKAGQNGVLDADLLRQITSSILIHPTGAVSLKLKNGQAIEKEVPK